MNAQRIDDRPQERESPVRHAHAVQASRHGRASAPGYLGLPADEQPENAGNLSERDESAQEADRPRRSPGRARAREARTGDGAGGQREDRDAQPKDRDAQRKDGNTEATARAAGGQAKRTQQTKKPRAATKTSAKRSERTGARTANRASASSAKQPTASASSAAQPTPSKAGQSTASKARQSTASKRTASRRKGSGTPKPASKRAKGTSAKAAAASVKSKVASTGENAQGAMRARARKEAVQLGGSLLKRALIAGSRRAMLALSRAGLQGLDGLLENAHRLPIQQSIDVAVPPEIAWEQWLELRHLPEGVHRLADVRREGEELTGRIQGPRGADWSAEVIDEREQESFAWRSTQGTDSAGLATFHPLGERLTRVELTVDVRPEDLGEAARLLLHIADRRVKEEMRRFKADAELLNPDVYEELLSADGNNGSVGDEEVE